MILYLMQKKKQERKESRIVLASNQFSNKGPANDLGPEPPNPILTPYYVVKI